MKEQIAILLYGTGSNGKSTLLSTIAHVMGDYCANTPFVTWQAQRTGQVPTDIAMLPCRRLVTAAETSVNARLNEARIKAVVGGDPITARHLYSSWFTYSPSFKLWLCVNHRPRVADDSLGFWRKMRLLPFERKFERDQDLDLREQLLSEESGILAWIIQGAVEWMRRGLNPAPEKVLAATKDWRVEADLLENFLQEACTQSSTAKARAGELYKAYNNWATKQGLQKDEILSNTAFGTKMSSRFDRDSDANGRFYRGIGLTQ
jgi:putative DNA primase/helicase